MQVKIHKGWEYFFWDVKLNMLASFIVEEVRSNGFSFWYHGKHYICPFNKAEDKIFYWSWEVPQYQAELARMESEREFKRAAAVAEAERRERAERNRSYQPHPDTMVVFGDRD